LYRTYCAATVCDAPLDVALVSLLVSLGFCRRVTPSERRSTAASL